MPRGPDHAEARWHDGAAGRWRNDAFALTVTTRQWHHDDDHVASTSLQPSRKQSPNANSASALQKRNVLRRWARTAFPLLRQPAPDGGASSHFSPGQKSPFHHRADEPPSDGSGIHLPLTQNPPKMDWEISFQVRKTGAALTSAERAPSYGKHQITCKLSRRRAALDPQELYSATPRLRRHEGSL